MGKHQGEEEAEIKPLGDEAERAMQDTEPREKYNERKILT